MSLSLVTKTLVFSVLAISMAMAAEQSKGGQGRRGPHDRREGGRPELNLTDEQKTCLDSKKPAEGSERPSKEAMDAIFTVCGIEKPAKPEDGGKDGGRHHGPELTDTQKQCLEGKGFSKDSGNRPSREAMEACGISMPSHRDAKSSSDNGDSAKFTQLTEAYLAASDSATQDARREELKALYFKTKDQNLKTQIQAFLSSHLPASVASTTETESVSSSGGGTR